MFNCYLLVLLVGCSLLLLLLVCLVMLLTCCFLLWCGVFWLWAFVVVCYGIYGTSLWVLICFVLANNVGFCVGGLWVVVGVGWVLGCCVLLCC